MPNQIQFLSPSHETPGAVYHWKPSPRLRRLGWKNLRLGTDWTAAVTAAMAQNDRLRAWETRADAGMPAAPRPRILRWRDLEGRYKASQLYAALAPASRAEYDSRLRTLEAWAQDGELPLALLDRQMIIQLRNTLVNEDRRPYRTAALLRVLSLLLTFGGDEGLVPVGIGANLRIPSPPRRTRRLLRDQLAPLLASADALGHAHVRLGIVLGFYSMQREADLLGATAFQLRPIEDVSSDARRTLAAPDGRVNGLWLQQGKTGAWVGVAMAPVARAEVEAAIAAGRARGAQCTNLILYPGQDRPCPAWKFQRDFRDVVDHAAAQALLVQDHDTVRLLLGDPERKRDAIQFRDLRRSGMCWAREQLVPVLLIASISGHSIKETQDILDTYMPRDSRAAAEGMAIAVARQAERDAADALEREGKADA